jgi:hypothetical protein
VTPTLRRLNDRERYFGLSWPGWFAVAAAGGVIYAAVRLSPFGVRATITVVVLLLAVLAMIVLGVSGQALSPGRHLLALVTYRARAKRWALSEKADGRGLVLTYVPEPDETEAP